MDNTVFENHAQEALESATEQGIAVDEDLAEVKRKWQQGRQGPAWNRWRWVVAVVLVGFVLWAAREYHVDQQPNRLYAKYASDKELNSYLVLRGDTGEGKTRLQQTIATYEAGRYEEALEEAQAITSEDPFAAEALFYQALSAIALEDLATAQEALDQAMSTQLSEVERINAHWYMALLQLKRRDITAATSELEWVINNSQGIRQSQAKALITELQAL